MGTYAQSGELTVPYEVNFDFNTPWTSQRAPGWSDRSYAGTPAGSIMTYEEQAAFTGAAKFGMLESGYLFPDFSGFPNVRVAGARITIGGENVGGFNLESFAGSTDLDKERSLFDLAMNAQYNPYMEFEWFFEPHTPSPSAASPYLAGLFLYSASDETVIGGYTWFNGSVSVGPGVSVALPQENTWYTFRVEMFSSDGQNYTRRSVAGPNGFYEEHVATTTSSKLADAGNTGITIEPYSNDTTQTWLVRNFTYGSDFEVPVDTVVETGDIFAFNNSIVDGQVIQLDPGEVLSIIPGSILSKNVSIIGPSSEEKSSEAAVIRPSGSSFTSPLFNVVTSGSLTLESVVLDGNDPASVGTTNVFSLISTTSPDAEVALQGVELKNSSGPLIDVSGDFWLSPSSSIYVDQSTFSTGSQALRTRADSTNGSGASLSIMNSTFENTFSNTMSFGAGGADTISLGRNIFKGSIMFSFVGGGTIENLTIGGPGNGNLFFNPNHFNVGSKAVNNLVYSHNWSAAYFGVGEFEDQNGFMAGNAPSLINTPSVSTGPELVNGTRVHSGGIIETNIIAQFDRDNDGIPDAWEIGDPNADFRKLDTSGNGIPDGIHLLLGLPIEFAGTPDPSIWNEGSLAADTTNSGYADWYEAVRDGLTGLPTNLGDLTDSGDISLSDAVRALQLINGSVTINSVSDPNRLNISGTHPFSLANPLQLLRFQAGVRSTLPAVPGIN